MSPLIPLIALLLPATFDLRPEGPAKATAEVIEQVELHLDSDGQKDLVVLIRHGGVRHLQAYRRQGKRHQRLAHHTERYETLGVKRGHLHLRRAVPTAPATLLHLRMRVQDGRFVPQALDLKPRKRAPRPGDLKARQRAARAALTKDPEAGVTAYLKLHAILDSEASLADLAFALMKAGSPHAPAALEAAAARATKPRLKGAAYYNLARHHLKQKDLGAAAEALHTPLRFRPGNAPTEKLLAKLRATLGVRAIDWGNQSYRVGDEAMQLEGGSWMREDEGFQESLELDVVRYGDLTGDGREEAFLHLRYWGGGTGRFDHIEVRDAERKQLAELIGGDRAEGGISHFEFRKGALHVSYFSPGPTGFACCPVLTFEDVWRWRDGKLRPTPVDVGCFHDEAVDEAHISRRLDALEAEPEAEWLEDLETLVCTQAHKARMLRWLAPRWATKDSSDARPILDVALRYTTGTKAKAALLVEWARALEKGNPKAALKAYQQALRADPTSAAAKAGVARVPAR